LNIATGVGNRPHGSEQRAPMQQDSAAASRATPADLEQIRHLRQILLWPVHLLPLKEEAPLQHHWEHLPPDPANPWRELDDEFGDPAEFQERHYNEFVTFPSAGPALPLWPGPRPRRAAQLRRKPDQGDAAQRYRERTLDAR
jgi:hypothetical protein